jgi:hypothetical protein
MKPKKSLLKPLAPALTSLRKPGLTKERLALCAGVAAFGLVTILIVPSGPSSADELKAYIDSHAQTLKVSPYVPTAAITRESYSATPGIQTLISGGTNYDWAKLVLLHGGWPITDDSVTVLVRWMRQENGAESWWNRNNPLNNGWGSGGGGGTGSYANLDIAAQQVVNMLNGNGGMSGIVAELKAGAPSGDIEAAIWASPWASGHYGDGSRWHYTPVEIVTAPASAW